MHFKTSIVATFCAIVLSICQAKQQQQKHVPPDVVNDSTSSNRTSGSGSDSLNGNDDARKSATTREIDNGATLKK